MRIATMRRRALAGVIDLATAGMMGLGAIAAGYAGPIVLARLRGENEPRKRAERKSEFDPPRVLRTAWSGAARGLEVAGRNSRGPGFRLCGLRRVDLRTGRRVAIRSAVADQLLGEIWRSMTQPLYMSSAKRMHERISALAPLIEEAKRTYETDPEARMQAIARLYQEHEVNPASGCGTAVVGSLVSRAALDLLPLGGRTLRDRLTGTAVVLDRP